MENNANTILCCFLFYNAENGRFIISFINLDCSFLLLLLVDLANDVVDLFRLFRLLGESMKSAVIQDVVKLALSLASFVMTVCIGTASFSESRT